MASVSARLSVPYPISAAERLWYDPTRWPSFVDGFGHLGSVEGDWPHVGASAVWDSNPGGRGHVLEVVEAYEPRVSLVTAVEDETLRGTQTVLFAARDGGTAIRLGLEYRVKARTPLTPLVDLIFIRRAQTQSLQRTLQRFGRELRGDQELGV